MRPEEDRALRQFGEALDEVTQWELHVIGDPAGHKVADDSELAKDDLLAHPYSVSPAPWSAISAAVSHLGVLRDSLFVHQGPENVVARIHTHGQFTLVRAALENSSLALWHLRSDSSVERITRRLQEDWEEVRQLEAVRELIGSPASRTLADREAEMKALLTKVGADPAALKKRPSYGEIVKLAGASQPVGEKTALAIWKACSSLAHGELRAPLAYLNPKVASATTPGMAIGHITGNIDLMVVGGLTAISTTATALKIYATRAGRKLHK